MTIPGLNIREWDVGLEMKSGETLIVGEVPQCGSAASHLTAVGDGAQPHTLANHESEPVADAGIPNTSFGSGGNEQ